MHEIPSSKRRDDNNELIIASGWPINKFIHCGHDCFATGAHTGKHLMCTGRLVKNHRASYISAWTKMKPGYTSKHISRKR
jgi:hypothetical protein